MTVTVISPRLFSVVQADLLAFIQKKLEDMGLDATEVDLHHSASFNSFRVYVTVSRTTNIKALYLAEQVISKEVGEKFRFLPNAFFWRYRPASL